LILRLNRTAVDRARIRGALDRLTEEASIDARDAASRDALWAVLRARASCARDDRELARSLDIVFADVLARVRDVDITYGAEDEYATALMAASTVDDDDGATVRAIVSRARANVDVVDGRGRNALHHACDASALGAVEALVELGRDALRRRRDAGGATPAMRARNETKAKACARAIWSSVEEYGSDGEKASANEDRALVRWIEREARVTREVAAAVGADVAPVASGRVMMFPNDAKLSAERSDLVTAIYFAECGFEDEGVGVGVATRLYKKYGDVLRAFSDFHRNAFPASLRKSYENERDVDEAPLDDIARAVYAMDAVEGETQIASTLTPSPLFVTFERTMRQTVDRSFFHAPLIPEKARSWLQSCESFVAVAVAGAYVAARLRDELSRDVRVILIHDFDPPCFVDDATVIKENAFSSKTLEAHSQRTLVVSCEPGEAGIALLRRAVDAFASAGGADVVAIFAHQDEAQSESALKSRSFVEDKARRAMSFTASERPYVFSSWSRSPATSTLSSVET